MVAELKRDRNGADRLVRANRNRVGSWEKFNIKEFRDADSVKYQIRTAHNQNVIMEGGRIFATSIEEATDELAVHNNDLGNFN